ncbi:hypothetical protein [Streptomyces sp. SPB162]|uniref:hypothetical protein n=1 Tax=Streptomyces sp. SPB162 TaxID=2940560 RepID=UPI00240649B0|nr:hypothetical protein [Streptomyces sp. SPB162]MDF9813762.1 hypothetical protein [Streptomyces sp. SPB162]
MFRNVFGSLIALFGAAAAVWSPFRAWYAGRHGSEIRIEDLFDGITPDRAAVLGSLFLPMLFAAVITLLGVLLRSRLLVACAGVIVLGFTILWMVRQGLSAGYLTAGGNGLGIGVANALGGGALLLIGAAIMSGRRHRRTLGHTPPHAVDPVDHPAVDHVEDDPTLRHPTVDDTAPYQPTVNDPAPHRPPTDDTATWPRAETVTGPVWNPPEPPTVRPTVHERPQ